MEEVLTKPLANPAQSAVGAVIYGLVRIIVPELANAAVVVGGRLSALDACIRRPLSTTAQHAQHVLGLLAREDMVLHGIVAKPACVPPFAGGALQLNIAAVVLASEAPHPVFLRLLLLLLEMIPFPFVSRRPVGRICRGEVLLSELQLERPPSVA
jgi:hypothetical protein